MIKPEIRKERLAKVLSRIASPAGKRVLQYIVTNPDAWRATDIRDLIDQ